MKYHHSRQISEEIFAEKIEAIKDQGLEIQIDDYGLFNIVKAGDSTFISSADGAIAELLEA